MKVSIDSKTHTHTHMMIVCDLQLCIKWKECNDRRHSKTGDTNDNISTLGLSWNKLLVSRYSTKMTLCILYWANIKRRWARNVRNKLSMSSRLKLRKRRINERKKTYSCSRAHQFLIMKYLVIFKFSLSLSVAVFFVIFAKINGQFKMNCGRNANFSYRK